jgi:hypothetical protein
MNHRDAIFIAERQASGDESAQSWRCGRWGYSVGLCALKGVLEAFRSDITKDSAAALSHSGYPPISTRQGRDGPGDEWR